MVMVRIEGPSKIVEVMLRDSACINWAKAKDHVIHNATADPFQFPPNAYTNARVHPT